MDTSQRINTTEQVVAFIEATMAERRIPRATYRIQFSADFTLRDAQALVPYLHALGISDVYTSPMLKARSGSSHGYDICDHGELHPALGGYEDFITLATVLREHGMGLIADVVPNHMGINDPCNGWWMDVLENGPSSPYAAYFDINWNPVKTELANKVLLPVLEDQYGMILENGKFQLYYKDGSLWIGYGTIILPVAPRTYIPVLTAQLDRLMAQLEESNEYVQELQSILTALNYLPPRTAEEPDRRTERQREKEIIKRRIAALYDTSPEARAALDAMITEFNGCIGDSRSFDQLDALIAEQPYRPAFWRVAAEEINYRRFFDINDLAAIRVELPEVFEATHQLIMKLLASEQITGLRIDHPDGLWDPPRYFRSLQERYLLERIRTLCTGCPPDEELRQIIADWFSRQAEDTSATWPLYVIAEKILSDREPLPQNWAVFGTTGYDFLSSVTGLFVAHQHEQQFEQLYRRFVATDDHLISLSFADQIHETKYLIMEVSLASEINALSHQLARITEKNRRYRDFTLRGITAAIHEVIACLEVYRTYLNGPENISQRDRHYITAAIAAARRRNPRLPRTILDFLHDTLLLRNLSQFHETDQADVIQVVMKFQQITGPVMAKSVEDTAFYRYNRLVSLNDVGGNPAQFGCPADEFHHQNNKRQRHWPHALLATTTHDTKRSEDVRARINVLSELPDEWEAAIQRWSRLNADKKTVVDGIPAPDANDEYLLYQTLVGVWPFEEDENYRNSPAVVEKRQAAAPLQHTRLGVEQAFKERMVAYMRKATKEAKVHTNWINPNEDYDAAIERFVQGILDDTISAAFLDDVRAFQRRIAYYGCFNALAQTLLKLTAPGVPDIYQGNELWDFSLVDPDNRRPVNYAQRHKLLAELQSRMGSSSQSNLPVVQELLHNYHDGRIKLFVIAQTLAFRREHVALFDSGDYQPLEAVGDKQEHVLAFARAYKTASVLVAVPRLMVGLTNGVERLPIGDAVWGTNWVAMPHEQPGMRYCNHLTRQIVTVTTQDDIPGIPLALLFEHLPVALLKRVGDGQTGCFEQVHERLL